MLRVKKVAHAQEVRLATLLRELPFTVAFDQRIIVFQNLVHRDKIEHQVLIIILKNMLFILLPRYNGTLKLTNDPNTKVIEARLIYLSKTTGEFLVTNGWLIFATYIDRLIAILESQ
jgi:hypothetical protein